MGELAAAAEAREREASIQHPSGFVVPCVAFTLHDAQISFGQADMEREKLEQAEQEGTFFEILCRTAMYIQIKNSFSVSMGSFFLNLLFVRPRKNAELTPELLQQARDQ